MGTAFYEKFLFVRVNDDNPVGGVLKTFPSTNYEVASASVICCFCKL